MLFVSGLMGPYMSPIPANASSAMVFSFFVAMTITPWLLMKIARGRFEGAGGHEDGERDNIGVMGRFYSGVASKLLAGREGSKRFLFYVGLATLASCMLFATKSVRVKLLPFDNKSEIAVVVDLPHGASLEETDRLLSTAAERLKELPELVSIQAYAGTAAPFNFNGLVRHYYLREAPEMGDLSINLLPKDERKRVQSVFRREGVLRSRSLEERRMSLSSLLSRLSGGGVPTVDHDAFAQAVASKSRAVVDVREPHEYAAGHIPGAINLPLAFFARAVAERKADRAGVSGGRALGQGFATSAWRGP